MPATNFTPILLYRSGTTTNQPTAGNLNQGELAINYADGRLFYKDAAGTPAIQIIGARFGANKTTGETIGAAFGAATGVTGNPGNFVFSAAPSFTGDISTTGTFSATKLIPTGNVTAGNGMYLPTTNTLAFSTNGSERMRIDSSGNVGIGTSSPSRILSIRETENTAVSSSTFWNATYGGLQINNQSTTTNSVTGIGFYGGTSLNSISAIGNVLESTSLGALAFFTGGQGRSSTVPERMRIDSAGNVGIGVTPSAWDTANSVRALQLTQGAVWGYGAVNMYLAANNYWNGTNRIYLSNNTAGEYRIIGNVHAWMQAASGTAGNAITFTQALTLDASGNLLLGGTSAGASSAASLAIFNGTAPTGSVTNGIILYAEDVSSSSELKVRDEAGNVTTLSPHNFSLIPEGPSEDMAWAYYSEKGGKRINVDMLKLARMVEKLTGEKLVYES